MNLKEVGEKLFALGWKGGEKYQHSSADMMWHKRFTEFIPRCNSNAEKPGIQICIKGWDNSNFGDYGLGFEIDITAECKDEMWIEFKVYGINEYELLSEIDTICKKLIRAWSAANED